MQYLFDNIRVEIVRKTIQYNFLFELSRGDQLIACGRCSSKLSTSINKLMNLLQTSLAALFALATVTVQAEVTFNFSASAEEISTQTFKYKDSAPVWSGKLVSSNGVQSAVAGQVAASINAWSNPTAGIFKAVTNVNMSGTEHTNIADTYARLDMSDTLRFQGAGNSVNVSFKMNYDTVFSGLGFTPFQRVGQIDHFMRMESWRSLGLNYQASNPNYDPGAKCIDYGSDGTYCPTETFKEITKTHSDGKQLSNYIALGGPNGTYTYGEEGNGHYTGEVVMSLTLPTNVDINLNYFAYNHAECFHMSNCSLLNDASHSDYLSLSLENGASFSSSNHYQYLGMAAAVPEPESYAMLLAGLGLLSALARRQRKINFKV